MGQQRQLYGGLHANYGTAMDQARTYFEAVTTLNAASRRMKSAAREFSTGASLYTLAHNTVEKQVASCAFAIPQVVQCHLDHSRCEQEYMDALHVYKKAVHSTSLRGQKLAASQYGAFSLMSGCWNGNELQ